ncbi:hypothetical protein DDI_4445 [Dickeya dianthicola RNS04.9]|nr:hypothetical protein DDI_4445 [Dickeya dianthicola RNS04.9]
MKRQYSLDLARLVAAYFVLFGHFVLSGTFDETSRTWVGSTEALPLLDKSSQSLWMFDIYLLEHGSGNCNLGRCIIFPD